MADPKTCLHDVVLQALDDKSIFYCESCSTYITSKIWASKNYTLDEEYGAWVHLPMSHKAVKKE